MKKIIILLLTSLLLCSCSKNDVLPMPEVDSGMRGELGIDKNINESNIDKYLNRDDAVYYDMRLLIDDANYEAIGGDSYLSGFVKGFDVVPYPYLCNVVGLPEAVGNAYSGNSLFTYDGNEYTPNYEESIEIINSLFPTDKYIFLMCGGGGYAGMSKNLLVALGYDANKIYNVGGYWYYDGENKVETKYTKNGETYYNFSIVDYHYIDFKTLHKIGESKETESKEVVNSKFEDIGLEKLHELENSDETFAIYVYLKGCTSCASFLPIISEFVEENELDIYSINLSSIFNDDNSITQRIEYSPSVFIYENGEVKAYLNPQSDEDLPIYKSLDEFSTWFNENVDISKLQIDCERGCTIN